MKLTRHNGRAGKNGVYNPKHNDRSFDIANSEHIDEERAKQNLYWDCYNGFRNFKNPDKEKELSATFEDVEQLFYRQRYRDFVTGQNERNVKNRHPERNKETGDLLKSKKTCPEETVYQIGTLDNHVPPELLIEIVTEFMETSVYKGYKQDKIEMRGDRAEMSDFPLYLNTVAGGLDRRDQTIGGFSFVVKIYTVPVVEIIG